MKVGNIENASILAFKRIIIKKEISTLSTTRNNQVVIEEYSCVLKNDKLDMKGKDEDNPMTLTLEKQH